MAAIHSSRNGSNKSSALSTASHSGLVPTSTRWPVLKTGP